MSETTFDVVFSGKLQAGADPAQVRVNLARLFKTEPAKVAHLFSGQPVPIKRGVDAATALQYQAALAKAGALVELLDTTAASAPAPAAVAAASADIVAAPAPAVARDAPVTVPPAMAARGMPPQAPDYSVAEPGAVLVEAVVVAPPVIDTGHLSVAAPGELLDATPPVAAPQYDLSGLTLDPPGTILSQATPVAPPSFDLSQLKLE
jgi:hypothetical protein